LITDLNGGDREHGQFGRWNVVAQEVEPGHGRNLAGFVIVHAANFHRFI
jgi:hypothetical protein